MKGGTDAGPSSHFIESRVSATGLKATLKVKINVGREGKTIKLEWGVVVSKRVVLLVDSVTRGSWADRGWRVMVPAVSLVLNATERVGWIQGPQLFYVFQTARRASPGVHSLVGSWIKASARSFLPREGGTARLPLETLSETAQMEQLIALHLQRVALAVQHRHVHRLNVPLAVVKGPFPVDTHAP